MDSLSVARSSYNLIVDDYDGVWSIHVEVPQQRLTRELRLKAGERIVDLGCGTGIDTVAMAQCVRPGEVLAVDPSDAMLETTQRRAQAEGLEVVTHRQGAAEFIAGYRGAPFDAMSLRFCLGYLDAPLFLRSAPKLLRPGGRLGIVSILSSSAPQAYQVYTEMASELDVSPEPMSAVASTGDIEGPLRAAGAAIETAWTHSFRLQFDTGPELATWLRGSGIATNPTLASLPIELQDALWSELGKRVESRRENGRIPLDFDIAGVVATVS